MGAPRCARSLSSRALTRASASAAIPKPVPATPKRVPAIPKPVPAIPKPVPAIVKRVPAIPKPVPATPKRLPAIPKPATPKPASPIAIATAALLVCAAAIAPSRSARAEDWRWRSGEIDDEADSIVRFQTRLDLWVATFNRPDRACKNIATAEESPPIPTIPKGAGLRLEQDAPSGGFGCFPQDSKELAFGPGIEVSFKVLPLVHVTAGFDLLYTDPSSQFIKHQVIVAVPFSILLTEYRWSFRPILQPTLTPILYVTDDARDYTLGLDAGVAWRVVDWGDLSLTVGYKTSETVSSWNFQVALHPI